MGSRGFVYNEKKALYYITVYFGFMVSEKLYKNKFA